MSDEDKEPEEKEPEGKEPEGKEMFWKDISMEEHKLNVERMHEDADVFHAGLNWKDPKRERFFDRQFFAAIFFFAFLFVVVSPVLHRLYDSMAKPILVAMGIPDIWADKRLLWVAILCGLIFVFIVIPSIYLYDFVRWIRDKRSKKKDTE